jgi:hypothetical protein
MDIFCRLPPHRGGLEGRRRSAPFKMTTRGVNWPEVTWLPCPSGLARLRSVAAGKRRLQLTPAASEPVIAVAHLPCEAGTQAPLRLVAIIRSGALALPPGFAPRSPAAECYARLLYFRLQGCNFLCKRALSRSAKLGNSRTMVSPEVWRLVEGDEGDARLVPAPPLSRAGGQRLTWAHSPSRSGRRPSRHLGGGS